MSKITGTVSELLASGLSVNGVPVNQSEISVLKKFGICEVAGKVTPDAPRRGKPAYIYSFPTSGKLTFSQS